MTFIILSSAVILAFYFIFKKKKAANDWMQPTDEFPKGWRIILIEHVNFYNILNGFMFSGIITNLFFSLSRQNFQA